MHWLSNIPTLLAFASILSSGCNGNTITSPEDVVFPDTNVRFRGHVQPFLAVTCAVSGCHADLNAAGGIRLTTYSTVLFDRPNLIVPGRPEESTVIQVLTGILSHPVGDLQRRVNSNHVAGMRQWVTEGALNN